jgi:hypothetical protein
LKRSNFDLKIQPEGDAPKNADFTQSKAENKVFGSNWCKKHGHGSKIGLQYQVCLEGTPHHGVTAG